MGGWIFLSLVGLFAASLVFCVSTNKWLLKIRLPTHPDLEGRSFPNDGSAVLYTLFVFVPTVFPVLFFTLAFRGTRKVAGVLLSSLSTRRDSMKKFVLKYLVVATLGAGVWESGLLTKAYQWATAPTPPLSTETQKLIASLDADGFKVVKRQSGNAPKLVKGQVEVIPAIDFITEWISGACVVVADANANGQFTFRERRAIDKAANAAVQRATVSALERETSTTKVVNSSETLPEGFTLVTADGYVTLRMPSGATYRFKQF